MKLLSVVLLVFSMFLARGQGHSIIPAPASWTEGTGTFNLSAKTGIVIIGYPVEAQKVADFFRAMPLVKNLNMSGKVTGAGNIRLELLDSADSGLGKEGYDLDISGGGIQLRANSAAGLFYGVQTIHQLIPVTGTITPNSTLRIPACKIRDTPRLGWRGLMLDVSRHFFTVDEVKQYID
ncbi:MAG TPA: beta-N-acetylhexosaminidase, partial [Saprospiraceae bacterium]|nr:beta-N-acetylhexosaminidase [Saprospiraceae bacterium]